MNIFSKHIFPSLLGGLILIILLSACGRTPRLKKYYPLKIGDLGWDTVYQTLPNFKMLNQEEEFVNKQAADSLLRIIQFFVSGCGADCEVSFKGMVRMQEEFSEDDDVQLISFGLSPHQDSIAIIKEIANTYQADASKWNLLVGNEEYIRTIAKGTFHLHIVNDTNSYAGIHFKPTLYLMDRESRIRGKYDPREVTDLDQLVKDIPILKEEYIPKTDWVSRLF